MGLTVCPVAVIAAPVETVWQLLSEPRLRDEWWDTRTERVVPEGNASPGQVIYLKNSVMGIQLLGTLTVESVDPAKHRIQWTLRTPGIINHQTTVCTALEGASCQVQYG
jgi:uncharacterized protein YndB with AHSA1/START domain